mmetsp:Transcript_117657/g.366551  ORF Transcript_117657/g.366551 Transcript_117657/m.366551 type:complete len:243 (+) Transcript_117657:22-750(+)
MPRKGRTRAPEQQEMSKDGDGGGDSQRQRERRGRRQRQLPQPARETVRGGGHQCSAAPTGPRLPPASLCPRRQHVLAQAGTCSKRARFTGGMASARISANRCGRFCASLAKALVVWTSATRLCVLEMKSKQRRRRRASPACSAIMRYSAAFSTVSQDESLATQSSTSDVTWYWCAASSKVMTSLSLSSSTSRAPTYMKRNIRFTADGSKSLMSTSFRCCSRMLLNHMALNTGDRAASTELCA